MIARRAFIERAAVVAGATAGDRLFAELTFDETKSSPGFNVKLAAEEDIYRYRPANNGAGPMWASGMTTIVRSGDQVVACGLETVPDAEGLSNCRWLLFKRYDSGWKLESRDLVNFNREPCSLAVLNEQNILMSSNPKQADLCSKYCPTHPEILSFNAQDLQLPFRRLIPVWSRGAEFTDHSYRAMAVDRINRELVLFQNYKHQQAEWSFLDKSGVWNTGEPLRWPVGIYGDQEIPLRLCYSNVALSGRSVYFFSTEDIPEPNEDWRVYKKNVMGRSWDYVFRRLFFSWCNDIIEDGFHPWVEIANYDETAGHIRNQDMWLDAGGGIHLLWTESVLDERLRDRFFPDKKQRHSLCYAVLRNGEMAVNAVLLSYSEGQGDSVTAVGTARFHAKPDGHLYVVCYVRGMSTDGRGVSENRLIEVSGGRQSGRWRTIPFKRPFVNFQMASERAGCAPSDWLDIIGIQEGKENTISYGRVQIG